MLRLFKIDSGLIRETFSRGGEALACQIDIADWIDAQDPTEDERATPNLSFFLVRVTTQVVAQQ